MIICVRSIQCFIDEYVLECDLFALNVLVFRSLFLKPNGTCILIRSVDSVPQQPLCSSTVKRCYHSNPRINALDFVFISLLIATVEIFMCQNYLTFSGIDTFG